MIVSCKMIWCPYHDERGYCAKPTVVGIDQMGMCSVLWRKGQQRQLMMPFTEELYPKDPITIIDAEIVIPDVTKEEKEKATESRSEDPTNSTAAQEDDLK